MSPPYPDNVPAIDSAPPETEIELLFVASPLSVSEAPEPKVRLPFWLSAVVVTWPVNASAPLTVRLAAAPTPLTIWVKPDNPLIVTASFDPGATAAGVWLVVVSVHWFG